MGHIPYDQDFYGWTQHQAEVLRTLSRRRRDLPNELDIDHVAEEIEDMGRSELRAVESLLRLILAQLLKASAAPGSPAAGHWRSEIATWHNDLLSAFTPSMRQRIDIDMLWRRSQREAAAALEGFGEFLPKGLPDSCPVGLDELLDEGFDARSTVERLRQCIPDCR